MINYLLIILLKTLRPLLGPAYCKFSIGCTDYAVEQLKQENLFKALWHIFKRIISCNPFN